LVLGFQKGLEMWDWSSPQHDETTAAHIRNLIGIDLELIWSTVKPAERSGHLSAYDPVCQRTEHINLDSYAWHPVGDPILGVWRDND
jgi:hypothetical protein